YGGARGKRGTLGRGAPPAPGPQFGRGGARPPGAAGPPAPPPGPPGAGRGGGGGGWPPPPPGPGGGVAGGRPRPPRPRGGAGRAADVQHVVTVQDRVGRQRVRLAGLDDDRLGRGLRQGGGQRQAEGQEGSRLETSHDETSGYGKGAADGRLQDVVGIAGIDGCR